MEALPIFMLIKNQPCLVVGGGEVASRKVKTLLSSGAQVKVVSPVLEEELVELNHAGRIEFVKKEFTETDIHGMKLVIAATDDEGVNKLVSDICHAHHIPVNVVDSPDLCSFTMPAIVDRSPILIAISSSGAAPVLARLIRAKLETMIPASYGRLASIAREFRGKVKERFGSTQQRRIFWEKVFQGPIAELVFSGQEAKAKADLESLLTSNESSPLTKGEVYLVGGGPGDPDLLTFRALRLMQQCDVCVYDKLVSQEVLSLVRKDAQMIYVGKSRNQHTLPQEDINQLLINQAQQGKRVLRLKGGDPFIFGRGGEEIESLLDHGVSFQVVPGITAANGVSTYAGIPLTHRDYAQTCLFTTGHLKTTEHGDPDVELDWDALVRPRQTVVIYMGLVGLAQICQKLIAHGLASSTPAAIVMQGTTVKQKVVVGVLENLAQKANEADLKPPSLIIIGEVVRLRKKLAWFSPPTAN
jgi:uroporphyrin-III C-methyltransferase / precorrin-2 dehydrogenase / sirohydrochlorin ferrochelatase